MAKHGNPITLRLPEDDEWLLTNLAGRSNKSIGQMARDILHEALESSYWTPDHRATFDGVKARPARVGGKH